MKIKGKLITYSLLLGLVPLALAAVVGAWIASNALHAAGDNRLSAIRDAKKQQVELYFEQIRNQVLTLSGSTMVQDAMIGFKQAFDNHQSFAGFGGANSERDAAQLTAVERYYNEQFAPRYKRESGLSANTESLIPESAQARALQAAYIADNPHPLGEKHRLDEVSDGSLYQRMHRKYHPAMRDYLQKFGYYDIFLVDIDTGNIVYSVFKELDFATSLTTGPYADSNFGEAFRRASVMDDHESVLVDYARYTPSYEAPAAFVASPIFREGERVGVLVFQMPVDRITRVLSQETGMGDTGEVYLVGADKLMRSNSRFDEHTTILRKSVDTEGSRRALDGETGVSTFEDGNHRHVLSAFAPVDIAGVKWGILAEIAEAEAFADITSLMWFMLGLSAVAAVAIVAVGIGFSQRLARPIVAASEVAHNITEGSLDNPIEVSGNDESAELLQALDRMQQDLKLRIQSEEAAAQNERIKAALDSVATPVVATDVRQHVIYGNGAAAQLLQLAAPELGDIVGQQIGDAIEAVHAAFDEQDDRGFSRRWECNGRSIDVVVTPVLNAEQALQGWVLQLIDRTEELAAAAAEQHRLTEERAVAEANTRIKVALDNASSSVMVADNDGQIIYANQSTLKLFSEAGDAIRTRLPDFDANHMLNRSFDDFHRNPQHQRNLLAGLTGTHRSEMEIGGRTIRIVANPVVDAAGQRLGTAVEWTDRTAEVAVEREIDALVEAASAGDLQQRIGIEDKHGFFRQLGSGINRLLDQLGGVFEDIGRVMSGLADGDLRERIERSYQGSFEQVSRDINSTMDNLTDIVDRLNAVSGRVDSSASEIASGNANLSARTEQQASSLQETASSMEELTSTVRNNADNAQQANQVAGSARQLAEKGGEVVNDAIVAMQQINVASNKIAEIIGVIDEIAFQTNLLALNASVEAARAGEQGRGFAVVATEVRNLASRSAGAAKEIKALINDSVHKVQVGSELVNQSGATLEEIVAGVKKVGDIVAEIAAASAEQAAGIDQVNMAITHMDNMTQQNAALAEQTSAASQNVSENAGELKQLIGFFRV